MSIRSGLEVADANNATLIVQTRSTTFMLINHSLKGVPETTPDDRRTALNKETSFFSHYRYRALCVFFF